MAVCFVARDGRPLDAATWLQLSGTDYRVVRRAYARGLQVACLWVGVWCTDLEPQPRPYCVEVWRESDKVGSVREPLYEAWCLSEVGAVEVYRQCVQEYLAKGK